MPAAAPAFRTLRSAADEVAVRPAASACCVGSTRCRRLPPLSRQRWVGCYLGPSVRLGCQLRPRSDIAALPLLPPDIGASESDRRDSSEASDIERFVAIMFVDICRSTALVEKRLPYDVIFLLNHFFNAVAGAVVDTGGIPNPFVCDGLMA